jgi:hypothetical protein
MSNNDARLQKPAENALPVQQTIPAPIEAYGANLVRNVAQMYHPAPKCHSSRLQISIRISKTANKKIRLLRIARGAIKEEYHLYPSHPVERSVRSA